jgi:hypothetical protein
VTEPPTSGWPEPAPASLAGPVGAREILWRGLDLNLAASSDVRRASILIGLLGLAAGGPLAAVVIAFGNRLELVNARFDVNGAVALEDLRGLLILVLLIGFGSIVALSIDSQLLAVDVIARRATGRAFVLRSSLEVVRTRFWRLLRANVLIAVILYVPRWVFEQVVAPGGVVRESQFVVLTIIGIVLSIPFAYVATWIVLGQVGARESVRRSWRLARARPPLALVIATVNTLFQTVALFALGSAADILFRIVDALGLTNGSGLGLVPLAVVIGLGIAAAGSLVMTIAALTAGPPVVAFLRLTGDASGLDALRDPDNPFAKPRPVPLVSRPMKIALVAEMVLALLAFGQLA